MGISNAADFAFGMQIPAIRTYPADTPNVPLGSALGAYKSVLVGCARAPLEAASRPAVEESLAEHDHQLDRDPATIASKASDKPTSRY